MDDQCSPLNWGYCYQEEGIEELKHCLLYTTLELERTIVTAHEEIARKEDELIHYKGLLSKILKERDEAEAKCKSLILEKSILQKHQLKLEQEIIQRQNPPEEGHISEGSIDEQDQEEDDHEDDVTVAVAVAADDDMEKLIKKPLPENGKFLQAVMEAGPLLQTLLLAGPLPQWQHPPPQLNSKEIPPVKVNMKRCAGAGGAVECQAPEFSPKSNKVPKVVHLYPLTNC
ncbi:uncharacterized protein LOC124926987 [Impatiens glandulifera]|uniref:uncharacterized protein LOC124926987 n=1 Tax=Impatiens glandulifera TaxID=253017 RepID=UPI001FB1A090|nr:uncharacterized protein LOC124926987 [Impatiens glandulifera]